MYLLRDENELDFVKLIDNMRIAITRDLKEAIIFDTVEKAKALNEYIELEQGERYFGIVEIDFKEVES